MKRQAFTCDGCGGVAVSDSEWEQPRGWMQARLRTEHGEALERHFCGSCVRPVRAQWEAGTKRIEALGRRSGD